MPATVMNTRRSSIVCALALLVAVLAVPGEVSAQDFEITPFAGYRFGGDFFELISSRQLDLDGAPAFGVAVDVPTSHGSQFEAFVTHQQAHVPVPTYPGGEIRRWPMTVDHYQAGGLHEFDPGRVRPFLTGSLGLTRYGTTGDNEIRFGFAAGGGIKLIPAGHIALRLESRVFGTFVDANGQAFACGPGTCLIAFNADVLWQMEFTAGLVIRFH
jgi:hypothetical protein